MDENMMTTAVDNYDGIFKFVHTKQAKPSFLQARQLLSEGKISEGVAKFRECHRLCDNETDSTNVALILEECVRYTRNRIIPDSGSLQEINWADVKGRKTELLQEPHDSLPQGIFLLKLSDKNQAGSLVILGRKTLSELWLKNLIPEIFCSQIRSDMFLGLLTDWRVSDKNVFAYYHPITNGEKSKLFSDVLSDLEKAPSSVDLTFPFPLLDVNSHKEITSPPEGWDIDPTFDVNLGHGEEHIRQVTVDVLGQLHATSHRLYDPACSTGVFLNTLKKAFPQCTTIGQDLSQKMCDVAKVRVDQVFCGNALQPKIPPGSADFVFIRFLNSEVVTTEEARPLFTALLATVPVGGILIMFGHTPVLLSADDFRHLPGFQLLRNVAVSRDKNSIFQYYVIKRLE